MKAKFNIGDKVIIAKKYKDRYNCLIAVGVVKDVRPAPGRKQYVVKFPQKADFMFFSYELEKVSDDQAWEIEMKLYKPDPKDIWKCPRCGSRNVHCHAGMYVDRFECQDCHWDWR